MNNIIYFDICAFIILSIFTVSLIMSRQLRDRANTLLLVIIELALLATIGDFLAAFTENYYDPMDISIRMAYGASYLYFLTHNLMFPVYTLYIYATLDIWHKYKQSHSLRILWYVLTLAEVVVLISNMAVKNVFVITDGLVYERRPLILVFYIVAAAFAVWGLIVIIRYRTFMQKDKVITLLLLYPIVFASIIIQGIYHEYLVEMLGISIAVLFFMIVMQQHEYQIDPITGAIKYTAGVDKLRMILKMRKPVTIIVIKITNHNNLRLYLGQNRFNEYLHMQTLKLSDIAFRHKYLVDVFYLENGTYAYLSDEPDINKAIFVADEVKEYMAAPMEISGFTVLTDAKICIARYPEDIEDFSAIFTFLTTFHDTMPDTHDVMLYAEHRNDMNFIIRNEMDEILSRALKENCFEMYYQPIYSTKEKRFISAEALIRLKDEKYGFISPGLFIPMAESSGAIHEIGDYVLNEVFDFIARNDMDELGLKYIEINLSAAQCIEVDLVDKIMHMIATKGIDASKVSLEITETAANINPTIVDANIHRLHEEGIRFALDDYGTGYSNIRRVTTLPVEEVKLDKSFVDEIANPQMWIVIRDTISMLREMGKEVLVEGVETADVADMLTGIDTDLLQGCELIQGFYYCKPLPEEEFTEFIKSRL